MYNTNVRSPQDLVNDYADILRTVKACNRVIISHDEDEEMVLISKAAFATVEEQLYHNYVNEKLRESEEWAANPDAKWLTEEETFMRAERDFGV
ncbi:MAG: hypothetical protein FWD34_07100 [Oscillospiraceae bacterium]|nr:hypothetical protein [Oscillospiraceae bacterium]